MDPGRLGVLEAQRFQPKSSYFDYYAGMPVGGGVMSGACGGSLPTRLPAGGQSSSDDSVQAQENMAMRDSLLGMAKRLMLPSGAPVIFSREKIIEYMPFKASFQECIDQYCVTDQERYQFLL